jgi:CheY-like chemotaxis protein
MRILVVDDDPAMLMVAALALENAGGFEVVQAQGGAEAIESARANRPDAILIDLIMPDVDGPDVLERLRAGHQTATIPVIINTAKDDPAEVRSLLARGAKGVIGKPFDPVELAGEIHRILAS